MTFSEALARERVILAEGAVVERLRRDPAVALDPHVAHAGFIYDPRSAAALTAIYEEYLEIARAAELPMICLSPTWRANPDRAQAAGLARRDLNGDGVRFLKRIRAESGQSVYLGGLLGCRGDAYRPEEGLPEADAARFHSAQVNALANAGPDFLLASTLPAVPEARGMCRAIAACGLPYLVSFVITADCRVLDGTPLEEAIASIDAAISPAPLAYMVNCVHPETLEAALDISRPERLAGFQANTSRRDPRELDGTPELETEPPEVFAQAMLRLHRRFGLRILGGCCGTDASHIRALAAGLAA
jgi:homocysteine S-methyltransferase